MQDQLTNTAYSIFLDDPHALNLPLSIVSLDLMYCRFYVMLSRKMYRETSN